MKAWWFSSGKVLLDALNYATGPIVWRVEMGGEIVDRGDKVCASERTYLKGGVDASDTLRKFARLCALDVIDLWTAPDVVVRYLKTGDESIRDAARDAAWDAAWAPARDKQNRRLTRMLNEAIK